VSSVCSRHQIKGYARTVKHTWHELQEVPQVFGRQITAMDPWEAAIWVDRAFAYWRLCGFPYPTVSSTESVSELDRLRRVGAPQLGETLSRPSTVGLKLANSFHPEMWAARVRGRSPLSCFEDDKILRHVLEKAVRFWPDRRCWNARCVRILVSIHNRGRVSNFRPTVARALIEAFSPEGAEVLDFSAGYGGRLLAALTLPCRYVGIDAATAQCDGLRRMTAALEGNAQIVHACAEDALPHFDCGRFDLVISSPPYFKLERYSDEPTQSYRRHPRYDLWLSGFLNPLLEHSHRVLRKKGQLILNVVDLARYPIAHDALLLASKLFGPPQHIYNLAMSTNPAEKSRNSKFHRTEPIFVFRK
jgi:SAM-dependent methyltransferase